MTRIQKRERMYALIKSYEASNQTQKNFCFENGINYSTFLFWLRQYRQNSRHTEAREEQLASGGFIPIKIPASEYSQGQNHFEFLVEYPSGIRVSFRSVPESNIIRELLTLRAV